MKNLLFICVCALMLFSSCEKSAMSETPSEEEPWGIQCMGYFEGEPSSSLGFNGSHGSMTRIHVTEETAAAICAAKEAHTHVFEYEGVKYTVYSRFRKARLVPPSQDKGLKSGELYYWVEVNKVEYIYAATGKVYENPPESWPLEYFDYMYKWVIVDPNPNGNINEDNTYPYNMFTWEQLKDDDGKVINMGTDRLGPNGEKLIERETRTYYRQLKAEWKY